MNIRIKYEAKSAGRPAKPVYPFQRMSKGDQFTLPAFAQKAVIASAHYYRAVKNPAFRISTETVGKRVRVVRV